MNQTELIDNSEGVLSRDAEGESTDLSGKYLTFRLASEIYGINILHVQEIIGMIPITSIPRTTKSLKGVINLRGKVIPVFDLRLQLEIPEIAYGDRTCIIVLEAFVGDDKCLIGVVVDTVVEVLNVTLEDIHAPPNYGSTLDVQFIQGMVKVGENHVVSLIDIHSVLSDGIDEAMNANN